MISALFLFILMTNSISFASAEDRYLSRQWYLEYTPQNIGANIKNVWSDFKQVEDIKIAIIDTGIDYKHPDLIQNIEINKNEIPNNGIDDDRNGFVDDYYGYNAQRKNGKVMDVHGHGTHVAGVIGASHNSQGIAGIMKKVSLIPIKVTLGSSGGYNDEDLAHAIEYAIERKADIIHMSLGYYRKNKLLKTAIEKTFKKNIVVVTIAHNHSRNSSTYPGAYSKEYSNIINVAASTKDAVLTYFTNYHKSLVTVFAPGEKIYSTVPNNKYKYMQGTSMAAPIVTGSIGLALSIRGKHLKKNMRQRVIDTSSRFESFSGKVFSNGLLNAYNLISGQTSFNYVWKK